jgi:uncharacterized protein with GYD domain
LAGYCGQRSQHACFGEFLPRRRGADPCPPTSPSSTSPSKASRTSATPSAEPEDYRGLVEESGGQVRQLLWTLGQYDLVVVTDFPDDETATAVVLQTVAGGNVRTTTMKAFDAEQMTAIIQRTG